MVNNEISGRSTRLIDNDAQSSSVRNEDPADYKSASQLSKRSPMMYMNQ